MRIRLLLAAIVTLALATSLWIWRPPASPAAERAGALFGERWYRLSLGERHLGYWHTRGHRDRSGRWIFESEQRFALNPDDPLATTIRRVFGSAAPHELELAEYSQSRSGWTNALRIQRSETGYRAERREGRRDPVWVAGPTLDWAPYTLDDYLSFEIWLHGSAPEPGASRTVRVLDFERTKIVNRTFDVVEKLPGGYVIENAAPYSATRLSLDEGYAPVTVTISGLFDLRLATREQALAPRSMLQLASYRVPTRQRLSNHTNISRLVIEVTGHDSPGDFFGGLERRDEQWLLTLEANPLADDVDDNVHQGSMQFPIKHPRIVALSSRATGSTEGDLATARALVRFVHRYLDYRPGAEPSAVLALLDDPRGDCTEFADLFTTLARSAGLRARTVFGLAYADRAEPAFAFHAWNEVQIDGSWMAVDPTWNLTRVDATHIPLPRDDRAALELLTGTVDLAFNVLAVDYFPAAEAGTAYRPD